MAVDVNVIRRRIDKGYSSTKSTYVVRSVTDSVHRESGVIDMSDSGLTHNYTYEFVTEFPEQPLTSVFKVYKVEQVAPGKYRRQDVPYYHGSVFPELTQFAITIDDAFTPDLTGVFIEFEFKEI